MFRKGPDVTRYLILKFCYIWIKPAEYETLVGEISTDSAVQFTWWWQYLHEHQTRICEYFADQYAIKKMRELQFNESTINSSSAFWDDGAGGVCFDENSDDD